MQRLNPKDGYQRTNEKILVSYIIILIIVQAVGLYLLFNNLNLNSAIIGAVAIGLLVPIFLALIFMFYAKKLKKN